MKPIFLKGHSRPLNQIKYNAEGDLVFSCSRDPVICVWFSSNGERLGTYSGHRGAVWSVDVDKATQFLLSGGGDGQIVLWDVQTGQKLFAWDKQMASARIVQWSRSNDRFLNVRVNHMKHPGAIEVFRVNRDAPAQQSHDPELEILTATGGSAATRAAWVRGDEFIVAALENHELALFSAADGSLVAKTKAHDDAIMDLQVSADGTFLITASKDRTVKLWSVGPDAGEPTYLAHKKTYKNDVGMNSAALIPTMAYLLCGGGQEASAVTTTSAAEGGFELRLFHKVYEEEVARLKGGFGPCNTIATHPAGKGYAMGSEEGFCRLYNFDEDFMNSHPYGLPEPMM